MTITSISKHFFLLVTAFISVMIFWGLGQHKKKLSLSTQTQYADSPLRIKGFSNSIYDDDRLLVKMEADLFKIKPRKFFVFNIKSVNEALLVNVRLNLYLYEGENPEDINLLPFLADGASPIIKNKTLKEIGLITRGVIKGLTLKIYRRRSPSIVLKGEKAIIDFKKGEVKITNASLEEIFSRKIIKSRTMLWNIKGKSLKLPGVYSLQTPTKTVKGRGITIYPYHAVWGDLS